MNDREARLVAALESLLEVADNEEAAAGYEFGQFLPVLQDAIEQAKAALAHARQQSGDAAEEAADQTKWASHYAKWAGRLYDALLDLEQAYNNKHSPQHRRAALAEARTVLAEYDAAAAPAQQEGLSAVKARARRAADDELSYYREMMAAPAKQEGK